MTNTDGYESRTYLPPASVAELAYYPAEQRLWARFRTGAAYSYESVPPEVWQMVRDGTNPGSSFRLLVVNKARPQGASEDPRRPYTYVREATS